MCTNPQYVKLGVATETLGKILKEMQQVQPRGSNAFVEGKIVEDALKIHKLSCDTVSFTFALYRLAGTIPNSKIMAVRKRQASDFYENFKEKHGKSKDRVKRILGKDLQTRLDDLLQGKPCEPVQFQAPSEPSESGLQTICVSFRPHHTLK